MSKVFLPPWLDPQSPLYGSLDPTVERQAQFIRAYASLNPTQDTYTAGEVKQALVTLTRTTPPLTE